MHVHTPTHVHTHAHRTPTHIHVSTCTYLCTYTTYTNTANNVISNSAPRSRKDWSLRERTQISKCHSSLPWESSQAIGEWEVTETTWVQKEKRCSGWIPGPSIHGINTRYRRRMWDQRCRRSSWQNPTAILRKKKNPPWIWIRKKLFNPLRAPTRVLSHIVVMTDCLPFPQDLEQTMYVSSHHTNCLCIGNYTLCNQAGKRSERQGERKHLLLLLDLSASRERPCLKNMRWSMIDKDTRCRPQCKDTHAHIWQDLQSKSKSKTYRN